MQKSIYFRLIELQRLCRNHTQNTAELIPFELLNDMRKAYDGNGSNLPFAPEIDDILEYLLEEFKSDPYQSSWRTFLTILEVEALNNIYKYINQYKRTSEPIS